MKWISLDVVNKSNKASHFSSPEQEKTTNSKTRHFLPGDTSSRCGQGGPLRQHQTHCRWSSDSWERWITITGVLKWIASLVSVFYGVAYPGRATITRYVMCSASIRRTPVDMPQPSLSGTAVRKKHVLRNIVNSHMNRTNSFKWKPCIVNLSSQKSVL